LLASSLLAVTVFSLSTMVAAYSAATNNVTPRGTKLLMEDNTSQNVLGTFIGAFLFSLVGIVALSTGLYGTQGRAILLVVTIGLIALIADHYSPLDRLPRGSAGSGKRLSCGEGDLGCDGDAAGAPASGRATDGGPHCP
jgi:hypothetical protein